jgi:hypothetical protein
MEAPTLRLGPWNETDLCPRLRKVLRVVGTLYAETPTPEARRTAATETFIFCLYIIYIFYYIVCLIDDGNKSIEYNDDYNSNILSSTAHHRHRIRSSLRFFTLDKECNYCYYRRVRLTYVTTAREKLLL